MKYGYSINIKWKDDPHLYAVWYKMLDRCYNTNHVRYNAYKNVTVCDRWLCFDYFVEDAVKIEGWDRNKFINKQIQLDKDIKQQNKTIKVYSVDACMWVDKQINNKYQYSHLTQKFIAVTPNGELQEYDSINQCAREDKLPPGSISRILHGKRKNIYGWTFFYK